MAVTVGCKLCVRYSKGQGQRKATGGGGGRKPFLAPRFTMRGGERDRKVLGVGFRVRVRASVRVTAKARFRVRVRVSVKVRERVRICAGVSVKMNWAGKYVVECMYTYLVYIYMWVIRYTR